MAGSRWLRIVVLALFAAPRGLSAHRPDGGPARGSGRVRIGLAWIATFAAIPIATALGQQCSPYWLPGAGIPGISSAGPVIAFDRDGSGPAPSTLVVGGSVQVAGLVAAHGAAAWDGNQWSALAPDSPSMIRDFAVHDSDGPGPEAPELIAGVISSGQVLVYRWAGVVWEQVGSGLGVRAESVIVRSDDPDGPGPLPKSICAAVMDYPDIPGPSRSRVLRWDGAAWQQQGPARTNASIWSFGWYDPDDSGPRPPSLVIVGNLYTNGILSLVNNSWAPIPGAPAGLCFSLQHFRPPGSSHEHLAFGGDFYLGTPLHQAIVSWDGSAWNTSWNVPGQAASIEVLGENGAPPLLVSGHFGWSGAPVAYQVALWDGQAWTSLGDPDLYGTRTAISFDRDGPGPEPARVIAIGNGSAQAGQPRCRIAQWDGESWGALGSGTDDEVDAFAVVKSGGGRPARVIAAGTFRSITGIPAEHIALLDAGTWRPLGAGLNGPAAALAADGSVVYAGGTFTSAGGQPVGNLAAWDGMDWQDLGGGVNGAVNALAIYDPDGAGPLSPWLVAGGMFTTAGGLPAPGVARWDGSSWSAMPGASNIPTSFAVYDRDGPGPEPASLILGTFGSWYGGASVYRWDGSQWQRMGDPFYSEYQQDGGVRAMAVLDPDGPGPSPGTLIAGGTFNSSGNTFVPGLAQWTGARWVTYGNLAHGDIRALATADSDGPGGLPTALAAAGWLSGPIYSYIGFFSDGSWYPIDNGLDNVPVALATADLDGDGPDGPTLLAGGPFLFAGGRVSAYFARAHCPTGACYANCDRAAYSPGLNIADFACFVNRFAAADPYADCTGDGLLNVADFVCFQGRFAAGCP